jgi:hypothetical protein
MTNTIGSRLLWLVPLAGLPIACSQGSPVNLGTTEAQLSDYASNWDGYAEAYTFPTAGSDRIRLTLNAEGQGTVEVGEAAPLPVPTQAAGGYPVDQFHPFRDGFQYPVHAAHVEAGRIHFALDPWEIYGGWCAFATPYSDVTAPSGYSCSPGPYGTDANGNNCTDENGAPLDCATVALCGTLFGTNGWVDQNDICTCTASACGPHVAQTDPTSLDGYAVVFDAAIDPGGATLTGTLAYQMVDINDRVTIRMTR